MNPSRAVILPGWGAKTVSLVHRASKTETLWQNPAPTFARTAYGDSYGKGEFAGFDEMFPTISRCFYESAPWAGTEVPDHGEVWTVPWECAEGFDHATFTVNGVRFPYRLQKTVSLQGEKLHRALRGGKPVRASRWISSGRRTRSSTRPTGMQFIVPRGMRRVINAVPGTVLGGYGVKLDFPEARRDDGKTVRLDVVPARNDTGYQKYWFEQKVTEGWCMLHDPARRLSIGMSFPPEQVPYLGMWLNEGGYAGQYNIAPEPATAAMDRIDFSKMWDRGSVLQPGEKREWHLTITVAEGAEPSAMSAGGDFLRD